jgi:hypothetical protein
MSCCLTSYHPDPTQGNTLLGDYVVLEPNSLKFRLTSRSRSLSRARHRRPRLQPGAALFSSGYRTVSYRTATATVGAGASRGSGEPEAETRSKAGSKQASKQEGKKATFTQCAKQASKPGAQRCAPGSLPGRISISSRLPRVRESRCGCFASSYRAYLMPPREGSGWGLCRA